VAAARPDRPARTAPDLDGAELEREARREVDEAVRFARESPYPSPELAKELVYAS
jgi:Pyruvate/2-oxoglutarate dehydrogenase complex, dehydrogenase (E1) component, eukaryotic type, alpha subunit